MNFISYSTINFMLDKKIYLEQIKKGFEQGFDALKKSKETGFFELEYPYNDGFLDFNRPPFIDFFDPVELERKYYIFSAIENINFDLLKNDFTKLNDFLLEESYKYGLIKGAVFALNELGEKVDTNLDLELEPLISIIMPAYNDEDSIGYAIESVLTQTYKNIELLIIDDGSSDKTGEVVFEYIKKDERVRYLHQTNTGVAGARNRGVKESCGEYIKLCDSDDVLMPYALEMLVRGLKYADETVKFIYDDYGLYFPEEDRLVKSPMVKPISKNHAYQIQLVGNAYPVGSVLINKEALINVGCFDPALNGTDDYDLWNRLLLKYNAYKLQLTIAYFQFCYSSQLSADLEALRCYTDLSAIKLVKNIDLSEVISNYQEIVKMMLNRADLSPITIYYINNFFYKNEKITLAEKDFINSELIEKSNKFTLNHYDNLFSNPSESNYQNIEKIACNYINTSKLRNKLNKLSFFDNETKEAIFDFHAYNKFYHHITNNNETDGHLVFSTAWQYSLIPSKWIEFFNTKLDQIFVPSKFVKENLSNLGVIEDKIKVVGYALNNDIYRKKTTNYELNTGKTFNFFCISKFTFSSGLDLLIKAYTEEFSPSDDVCLIFMNDFIYDYERKIELEELAKNTNLPKMVIRQNNFIKEDLADIYNSIDTYVYPYRLESFGSNVAEAMLCEKPVIVTQGGGTDDFCNEENTFLIETEGSSNEFEIYGAESNENSYNFLLPDINHLKKLMRYVFDNKNNIKLKNSREAIINKYSEKSLLDKISNNLNNLKKEPIIRKDLNIVKEKLYGKAETYFKGNDFANAEKTFIDLSKYDKKDEYYYKLGICQYELEKYEEAIFSFSLLMEIGLINKEICIFMANSLEKIGAFDEAKDFKIKAKELNH